MIIRTNPFFCGLNNFRRNNISSQFNKSFFFKYIQLSLVSIRLHNHFDSLFVRSSVNDNSIPLDSNSFTLHTTNTVCVKVHNMESVDANLYQLYQKKVLPVLRLVFSVKKKDIFVFPKLYSQGNISQPLYEIVLIIIKI